MTFNLSQSDFYDLNIHYYNQRLNDSSDVVMYDLNKTYVIIKFKINQTIKNLSMCIKILLTAMHINLKLLHFQFMNFNLSIMITTSC